jgi:hypothetical protein
MDHANDGFILSYEGFVNLGGRRSDTPARGHAHRGVRRTCLMGAPASASTDRRRFDDRQLGDTATLLRGNNSRVIAQAWQFHAALFLQNSGTCGPCNLAC